MVWNSGISVNSLIGSQQVTFDWLNSRDRIVILIYNILHTAKYMFEGTYLRGSIKTKILCVEKYEVV